MIDLDHLLDREYEPNEPMQIFMWEKWVDGTFEQIFFDKSREVNRLICKVINEEGSTLLVRIDRDQTRRKNVCE